jgi:hypothetical protein
LPFLALIFIAWSVACGDAWLLVALALALTVALAALARRRDLASAAVIGLGLCLAIGVEAAFNPASQLLAETLGYTMWWGSVLGFWVWLALAFALRSALLGGWRRTQTRRMSLPRPAWARTGAVARRGRRAGRGRKRGRCHRRERLARLRVPPDSCRGGGNRAGDPAG